MKILIAGGHLTPALGVIEHLPKNTQIVYVGRKYALEGDFAYSLEYQTISERGIAFEELVTGRLQRKLSKHTISSLLKTVPGLFRAISIVRKFHPDVILGFGGYVSLPLCIAGKLLRIPVVIHEQTLTPGLANKMLTPFASKICISWEESRKYFPQHKTVLTGNPSLSEVFALKKQKTKNSLPNLTIVGGSLGSHAINMLVESSLEQLLATFTLFFQTGDAKEFNDFDRISKKVKALPKNLQDRLTMVKFVSPSKIVEVLAKADIAVTRAGMNTLSTLFILGIPSLIIPLSLSLEQKHNATFFKTKGLGEIGSDAMDSNSFVTLVSAMMRNRNSYKIQNETMPQLHKNAAENVIIQLRYVQKTTAEKKN